MSTLRDWDEHAGVELLQRLPLFRPLSFEETRKLASISHIETRARGEVIVEQEALGVALYLIVSGAVVVTRDAPQGAQEAEQEVSLGRLGDGEMFGEMSLVDDELTSARVTALENVELLVLPRGELESLIESDQAIALKIYQAFCKNLCARLRRANPRLPVTEALKLGVY